MPSWGARLFFICLASLHILYSLIQYRVLSHSRRDSCCLGTVDCTIIKRIRRQQAWICTGIVLLLLSKYKSHIYFRRQELLQVVKIFVVCVVSCVIFACDISLRQRWVSEKIFNIKYRIELCSKDFCKFNNKYLVLDQKHFPE